MQTYTHALMGAALGSALFPGNYLAQVVCVGTSVLPDLVMVPQFIFDTLAGRQPLATQSKRMMVLKEIGHSFPLWLLFIFVAMIISLPQLRAIGIAFALGGMSHVIVDVLTHGTGPRKSRPFWDTDVTFMWPFNTRWPILDLRPFGLWEYRYDHGVLKPKPFEAITLAVCAVITLYFQLKTPVL